jgi:multisubunit Na+/H+ antiporter MnhB subunit
MEILFIGIIVLFVLQKNRVIDGNKFIKDNEHYFKALKEDDYDFLVRAKYGEDAVPEQLFSLRVRNAVIVLIALVFLFLTQLSFLNLMAAFVISYFIFKSSYSNLKSFYKRHLHDINLQLPYFLKTLEVLAQHYTIPNALAKSIDSAPEIFRAGLRELIEKINSGDSTVEPYMDFAKQYPVADSMRMMRLLYRLGLGSQENKHEQLIMFSKSVSSLQNKARETRYKERLGVMENKTLIMLGATGGGVMLLLLLSMLQVFAR